MSSADGCFPVFTEHECFLSVWPFPSVSCFDALLVTTELLRINGLRYPTSEPFHTTIPPTTVSMASYEFHRMGDGSEGSSVSFPLFVLVLGSFIVYSSFTYYSLMT
jgi:hypothetical protein